MARRRVIRAWRLVLAVACASSCRATAGLASEPERRFTSRVYAGSLDQAVLAINKAFGNGVYHRKHFFAPPYDYVVEGERRISVPLTNAWMLSVPVDGRLPLTLIPAGKQMVAYDEDFFMKAEAVGAERTRVSISSAGSGTTERSYELSPHLVRVLGGRYHPPLPSETTKLFLRIEAQLAEVRAGRTNALPPTADTAPGYYLQFWTSMNVEQKHDRRNWERMVQAWKELQEGHKPQPLPPTPDTTEYLRRPIKVDLTLHPEAKDELLRAIQAETNAALKAELLKMLIAATNGAADGSQPFRSETNQASSATSPHR